MRILFFGVLVGISLFFSSCAGTTATNTLENNNTTSALDEYSIDDIRINLVNTKIYNKPNNQLITGQIIVKNEKNHLYYEINNGLLSKVNIKDPKEQNSEDFFIQAQYNSKELIHFFMQEKEDKTEIKFKNHHLTDIESIQKLLTIRLNLDNNNVKNFFMTDLKYQQVIKIANNKVQYFKLPNNELMKSTDFSDDLVAKKLIEDFKNILNKKPFKYFTYKAQIASLYSMSKSLISIEECQNLIGKTAYDRLLELYQNNDAVLMQCENKAFEGL